MMSRPAAVFQTDEEGLRRFILSISDTAECDADIDGDVNFTLSDSELEIPNSIRQIEVITSFPSPIVALHYGDSGAVAVIIVKPLPGTYKLHESLLRGIRKNDRA